MKIYTIEKEYKGYTIKEYLKEIKKYSGRSFKNLKFVLNNKNVKSNKKLRPYNKLKVLENKKISNLKAIDMKLDILYEDDNIMIVNKPPFILTHPTLKKADETLANGIVYYFQKKYGEKLIPRFYNRLDMNTSGIIIVAKNGYSQSYLQNYDNVHKYYLAVVHGIIRNSEFIIKSPIGKIKDNIKREILSPKDGGQKAKSKIKVIRRNEKKDLSLLEVKLFTGRTHQIRVHLSSIGHAIVGDTLYGGSNKIGSVNIKRQLLHAYKVQLPYIETDKTLEVKCSVPEDMKWFFKEL